MLWGVCGDKNNFCLMFVLFFSCFLLLVKFFWYYLDMLIKINYFFIIGICLVKFDLI